MGSHGTGQVPDFRYCHAWSFGRLCLPCQNKCLRLHGHVHAMACDRQNLQKRFCQKHYKGDRPCSRQYCSYHFRNPDPYVFIQSQPDDQYSQRKHHGCNQKRKIYHCQYFEKLFDADHTELLPTAKRFCIPDCYWTWSEMECRSKQRGHCLSRL